MAFLYLPGIMPLMDASSLARQVQNIKQHNALLFDFALKRLLRHDGNSFPAGVFETRKFFEG